MSSTDKLLSKTFLCGTDKGGQVRLQHGHFHSQYNLVDFIDISIEIFSFFSGRLIGDLSEIYPRFCVSSALKFPKNAQQ